MISADLAKTPNERIKITDDRIAVQLITELGLIHHFENAPRPQGRWTITLGYADHVTHWIVGTGDDGYFIFCTPKSQQSSEDALQMLKDIARSNADGPLTATEHKIDWTRN